VLTGPFCLKCGHSKSHHMVWPNYQPDDPVCEICYHVGPRERDAWHAFVEQTHVAGVLLDPIAGWHSSCSCGWGRWQDTEALARQRLDEHWHRAEQNHETIRMSDYDADNNLIQREER